MMKKVNPLTNFDIINYVEKLELPNFRGVFMRDTLPRNGPQRNECGIMNLNLSNEKGSHWVCYYRDDNTRIYFDSFGQITPIELQKYLKTKKEFANGEQVIQRNTDIVQNINSSTCGHLCLIVLTGLTKQGKNFQEILNTLRKK